jgi:hypothetical protein
MDLEQFLLENSRTKAGPVDVQEVRSARGPGKYDTRVSKDVDGFQAFADVDVGGKKLSQVGASFVGRGRIGNYEVQYVYDPETKQPVITGAIRKELSPTSDVSAEGVYVPQKDGKDYYNAGVRYTKRFEDGGAVNKFDDVAVESEVLRKQLEKEIPKGKYFESYPVEYVGELKTNDPMLAGVTKPYKEPNVVSLNPKSEFGTQYGTFEHERQHLLDAKRGKKELRYPAPEYMFENAKWEKPPVPIDEKLQSKTRDDIILSYQKYRKKYDLSNDFTQEGFFGDIRAIEKRLPVGKGILDTDIGKDLFGNNPELLLTYWSRTRPEKTTYMTEQRDSPRFKTLDMRQAKKAPEAGPLTKVQDFIRAKTATYFEDGGEAKAPRAVVSQEESGLSPEQYAKALASYDLPEAELDAILEPTKAQKYAKNVLDTVRPGKEGIYGEKEAVETMYADMYGNPSGRYFDTGKGVLNKINAVPKLPAAGVYTNATPDEVTVNVNSGLPNKNVFVHELQHKLDDDQGFNRNNRLKAEKFPEAYVRDLGNNKRWTDTSEDYSTLYDNVKNAYSTYRKKYMLSGDFTERGLIPELKRIESTLPVGKNIFDTDIGKAVSKDLPKFKFAYYNQTAPSKGTYMYSVDTAEQAGALRKAYEPGSEKDIFAEPKRTVRALKEKVTDFIKTKKFEDGGDVTSENVRTLKSIDVKADKPEKSRVKENIDAILQGLKNEDVSAKDVALFINSFIPVSGDIQSAAEGYQAFKDKDYLGAGLGAAGALPLIPNITKYVKASPKEMDKFFEEMASSKIRDAEGQLAKVYHGGAGLEEGLPTKGTGIFAEGVYFSGIPSRTRYYGEKAKNGTTYPMYANIKNPISSEEFTKRFGTANPKNSKKIRDILVAEGYDGVLSKSGDKIWEGVSFFPEEQLKSSVSSITPKMKDEMLKEDVKAFNKYAHGGEVGKFIKSKK